MSMSGPGCAVMCNLINTHTHSYAIYEELNTKQELYEVAKQNGGGRVGGVLASFFPDRFLYSFLLSQIGNYGGCTCIFSPDVTKTYIQHSSVESHEI